MSKKDTNRLIVDGHQRLLSTEEQVLARVRDRLRSKIDEPVVARPLWPRYAMAAAFILIVGAGLYLATNWQTTKAITAGSSLELDLAVPVFLRTTDNFQGQLECSSEDCQITMSAGASDFVFAGKLKKPISVVTPDLNVTVTGTAFRLTITGGQSKLYLFEGSVKLTSLKANPKPPLELQAPKLFDGKKTRAIQPEALAAFTGFAQEVAAQTNWRYQNQEVDPIEGQVKKKGPNKPLVYTKLKLKTGETIVGSIKDESGTKILLNLKDGKSRSIQKDQIIFSETIP